MIIIGFALVTLGIFLIAFGCKIALLSNYKFIRNNIISQSFNDPLNKPYTANRFSVDTRSGEINISKILHSEYL